MKKLLLNAKSMKKGELIGGILLLAIFVLPFLSYAKSSRVNLYVDARATLSANGTAARPYHTISEALSRASEKTDVHVAAGTYKENIKIPEKVSVFGSDKNSVIITAATDDEPTVIMRDESKINKVTIEKGQVGIRVNKNAEASIIKCRIRNNDKDGIKIADGDLNDGAKVSITDSEIIDNGRSGIFSEKRKLSFMDNEIRSNDTDGIDLASGSEAFIEDNNIQDNGRSGMRLRLDGSNIWTKKNTFRNNNREGIEVDAFGGKGRIDIKDSKFNSNDNYGVSRVQFESFSTSVWNGLTFQNDNDFNSNGKGSISAIIRN